MNLRPAIASLAAAAVLLLYSSVQSIIRRRHIHRYRYYHQKKQYKLPPGNTGLPIVGYTLSVLFGANEYRESRGNLRAFLFKKACEYGEIYITSIPPLYPHSIIVNSPEAVQFILSRDGRGVTGGWGKQAETLLGKHSITILTGKEHKKLRYKLLPIFQPKFLEQYNIKINHIVKSYLKKNWGGKLKNANDMSEKCDTTYHNNNNNVHYDNNDNNVHHDNFTLNANEEMKSIIFAIGVDLILGLDTASNVQKDEELSHRLKHLIGIWLDGLFMPPAIDIPITSYSKALKARNELVSILSALVKKSRMENVSNAANHHKNNILSVLLQPKSIQSGDEEPSFFDDEEIIDTLLVLIFAASDTSSCTIPWIMKKLAEDRDIFNKLKKEHEQIVTARHTDDDDDDDDDDSHHHDNDSHDNILTYQEIEKATYTKKVINEALRSVSVVGATPREATEDLYYKDYIIPKGSKIIVDLCTLSSDPNNFPSPETFDPDRSFEPQREREHQNQNQRHNAFLPFGYGVKMCIGNRLAMIEMTTMIHHLVLGYEWEVSPDAKAEFTYFPLPKIDDGLPIKITKVH